VNIKRKKNFLYENWNKKYNPITKNKEKKKKKKKKKKLSVNILSA